MSLKEDFYRSPVSKAYATVCFMTTVAYHLHILNPEWISLDFALVTKKYQIWRLLTNFFFLGEFSMRFGLQMLIIAIFGVKLEQQLFYRGASFLNMMIASMISCLVISLTVPFINSMFMGGSLVFMLLYVWSPGFPKEGFWLPWALLLMNSMFGAPLMPGFLGIIVGNAYDSTVLNPRPTGQTHPISLVLVSPFLVIFYILVLLKNIV